MAHQLQGKNVVLYVLNNDENSKQAINFARHLPDIYIQSIDALPPQNIPTWLDTAPTCVDLQSKDVRKGSAALNFLQSRYQRLYTPAPPAPRPPQRQPMPPQGYGRQPPLQPPRMPPGQPGMGMGMGQPPPSRLPPTLPPGVPQEHMFSEQNMPGHDTMLDSSLKPATGSGSYGCSLNDAFQSIESEQITDSRYTEGSGSSVSETDRLAYMQMRDSTMARQG